MHRLFTHVKTLKRKENQCSHWFLEKTKILPVHTDVFQEPLVVNWRCLPCCSVDPCLSHIGLTSRWNPDLISCAGMEETQDRRFRKPTELGVPSAPLSGGYFLLTPGNFPLTHEVSKKKKCSLVWCYRRMLGASALSSPGLACLTFNTRLSHRGSETEVQGWMAAGADTPG